MGEIRRASGTRVLLLRSEDSVLAKMRQACDEHMASQRRLHGRFMGLERQLPLARFDVDAIDSLTRRATVIEDSIKQLNQTTLARLDSLISSSMLATAMTRIDARFRFENVKPGDYVLWAQDRFGGQHARWAAQVSVEPGETETVDLWPALWCGARDPIGAVFPRFSVSATADPQPGSPNA